MMRGFAASVFALLATVHSSTGNNSSLTTSRVEVHIPFDLHRAEGSEHDLARFGFKHSSGSIATYVQYADSFLCDAVVNKTKGFPALPWPTRDFILLADRGGPSGSEPCSAVTKARNAQQAGASALVIADLHCRCDHKDCLDAFGDDATCETGASGREFLVDDGSAADVSIPTFLLYKQDAKALKDELRKGQTSLMELTWGIPKVHDDAEKAAKPSRPHYHLWTSAHDPLLDIDTVYNMKTVALAMVDDAIFAPRYSVIDGTRFQCNEQRDTGGPCDHLCTNNGRYCSLHAKNLSGRPIVTETLRQLCIWNHYGAENTADDDKKRTPDPKVWWDYVIYRLENCNTPSTYDTDDCLKKAFHHAKVDAKAVDDCMKDSGDIESDTTNTLLEGMLEKKKQSGVTSLPALTVNHEVLDHTSSWSLFEGICTHYWRVYDTVPLPKVCETCGMCPNKIGCLEQGHCVDFSKNSKHHIPSSGSGGGSKKSGHGWTFFWLLVIGAGGGGGWYYYKQREDELRTGGILNDYVGLGSGD